MKNNKSDGKCDGEEAAAALDRPAAVTHIGLMRQRQAGGSVNVLLLIRNLQSDINFYMLIGNCWESLEYLRIQRTLEILRIPRNPMEP